MQNLDEMNSAELRNFYIRNGGNPNLKKHQAGLDRALQAAERDIQRQKDAQQKAIPVWLQTVKQLVALVLTWVSVLFVFALLVLLVAGTVLLVWAEIAAVRTGFSAVTDTNSWLYSIAIVSFYLVVLFIKEVHRDDTDYKQEKFSVVLLWKRLQYTLGLKQNWQPEYVTEKPLMVQITGAIRLLMGVIILAGIVGRIYDETQRLPDGTNWRDALLIILSDSSLEVFLGTIAVVLMTFALLVSTHFIIYFIVTVFKENTGGIKTRLVNFTEVSPGALREKAIQDYWKTELMKLQNGLSKNSSERTNF